MIEDFPWLVFLFGIFGFIFLIGIIFPIQFTTGYGEHVGYVTAVDQTGLFWRNYHIYFKTETESSQEDEYCVMRFNPEMADNLKRVAESKSLVSLKYRTLITLNPSLCHSSEIKDIKIIK